MTTKITFSLPPNIDVTVAPIAFGKRAIPKLKSELKDDQLIIRQRALVSLSNLLHDPEKVYEAIGIGLYIDYFLFQYKAWYITCLIFFLLLIFC